MDKKIIIMGVVLVAILLVTQSGTLKSSKKLAPPGAVVTRSTPAKVPFNTDTTITVTVSGVATSYFAILRENIPSGWTYVSGGQLEGSQVKGIASTLTSNSVSFILKSPSTTSLGTTLSGTYQFSDDVSPLTTTSTTIKVCAPQSSSTCYNNDVYWYDSCNDRETVKQDCGDASCDAYGANYCSALIVKKDRTCYDKGCSGSACFNTPSTDTATVTTCAWQCSSGNCQRNSYADTNNNGAVSDTELLTYANSWLGGSVTDINLLNAAAVWLGQASYPVSI